MNINEAIQYLLDHSYGVEMLDEASESDAYRRTKAKLDELPDDLKDELKADAKDPNHWQRECYETILATFGLRNTEALYYAPGLARIAFGELDLEGEDEDSRSINLLRRYVHFITTAHKDDFDRYLNFKGPDGLKECSFEDLDNMFGQVTANNIKLEYNDIANKKYKKSDYKIIWLKDFETAEQYCEYTEPNVWCYFDSESTFESYTNDGLTKLYLAVKPGFENMKPGDPGYGQSMLGIDVNQGQDGLPAELVHVSNRYNHAEDPELDNKKNPPGDNRFDATELSDLLGAPFWELCPPPTREELHQHNFYMKDELPDILNEILSQESPQRYAAMHYKFDLTDRSFVINGEKHRFYALIGSSFPEYQYLFDENKQLIGYMLTAVQMYRDSDNNIVCIKMEDKDYNTSLYTYKNNKLIKLFNNIISFYPLSPDLVAIKDENKLIHVFNKSNCKSVPIHGVQSVYDMTVHTTEDKAVFVVYYSHQSNSGSSVERVKAFYYDTMYELNIGDDCFYYVYYDVLDLIMFQHKDKHIDVYSTIYDRFLKFEDTVTTFRLLNDQKFILTMNANDETSIYKYNYNNGELILIANKLTRFGKYNDGSGRSFAIDAHNKEITFDNNFNIIEGDE